MMIKHTKEPGLVHRMNNPITIGKATIYNYDCMELLKATPDKFYDLAIVDPPYGINVANNTTGTVIRNKSDRDIFTIKEWDKATPDAKYFAELMRVSKEQIIWGGELLP